MKRYSEFQPTGFDCKGLGIPDKQHWLVVPVSQTCDGEILERCNFNCALAILGGEHELCEVHRFGHWGPGWFEIIIIHPALESFAERNIIEPLEDYPILDEEKFSEMELEEREEDWQNWAKYDFVRELKSLLVDTCSRWVAEDLDQSQDDLLESVGFFFDLGSIAETIIDDLSESEEEVEPDTTFSEFVKDKACQSGEPFTGRLIEDLARYVYQELNYGDDWEWQAIDSAVAEFLVPRMRQHDLRFARIILDIYDNDNYRNEYTIEAESLLRFAEREGADCV